MVALMVQRAREALADEAPLDGEVGALVDRENFVYAPAHRAVINNDVRAFATKAVLFFARSVARPEAEVSDDQIMGVEVDLEVLDANAVAGRGLPRYGQVRMNDFKL